MVLVFIMTKYVKSQEALPSNLHIWDPVPTQTAITETKTVDFYPTSAIDSSDTLSFVIPAMQKYMLDNIQIVMEIRVLTAAGGNPVDDNPVSTTPHLAAALFRNVDVSIAGVSLTQSFDNSYAMLKFWSDVLHHRESSVAILKKREGFLLDEVFTKGDSEDVNYFPAAVEGVVPDAVNKRGRERCNRIKQGRTVCLVSDFNVALFKQDKLLPTGIEIRVNLTKNYSEFILLSAADRTEKVVFDNVSLRCTFQKPTDMILSLIEERLAKENAIYHADKSILSFHSITRGAQEFTLENIFNGILPYYFLVGVQDRAAFGRDRTKNPFSLHEIKKIQLFVNGQEHFSKPIEKHPAESTFMYDAFLRESGDIHGGDTLLSFYYACYPAMGFDLTQDKTQNQHSLNLVRNGTARLTIELPDPAPANQVLMILAWYEQVIEITKDRQLLLI